MGQHSTRGNGDFRWDTYPAMAVRGAIGGLVAGLVFGLFQMWFVADAGLPANTIIHMIATIVQPDEYFATGQTSLAIGWAVHIALSIGYGAILGLAVTEMRSTISRVVAAAVWGLMIYIFNFLVLAPMFYPVFDELANQPFEATAHVVYGALIAPFVLLWKGRVKPEPALPPVVDQWRANGAPPLSQGAAQQGAYGQSLPQPATFDPQSLR